MSYKILEHLDHVDMLEINVYPGDEQEAITSVVVECTKCGVVIEEIYDVNNDNTPPLDVEFPDADRPTWEDGVRDALRIVEARKRTLQALDHPNSRVFPILINTVDEVHVLIAAMLSRGSYESHDTVMQTTEKPPFDADFLARQIVDDLYRAGIDARFQQHTVEQTIQAWLAGSGRRWGR
jgi:hypothetical protein